MPLCSGKCISNVTTCNVYVRPAYRQSVHFKAVWLTFYSFRMSKTKKKPCVKPFPRSLSLFLHASMVTECMRCDIQHLSGDTKQMKWRTQKKWDSFDICSMKREAWVLPSSCVRISVTWCLIKALHSDTFHIYFNNSFFRGVFRFRSETTANPLCVRRPPSAAAAVMLMHNNNNIPCSHLPSCFH